MRNQLPSPYRFWSWELLCFRQAGWVVKVETYRCELTRVEHLETYEAEIGSMKGVFNMQVNKGQLLSVDNSNYEALIGTYPHLEGVQMNDNAAKPQLPVDVVLGGGEYARIKTDSRPQIGKEGEPVAELTKLEWFIMSPGEEFDHHYMLLTQTSQNDYV